MKGKKATVDYTFDIPTEEVLEFARTMSKSQDRDERIVGQTVVELTEISTRTKDALEHSAQREGSFSLEPYFDFDFGGSLDAAERLAKSEDNNISNVSHVLKRQHEAVTQSRESFLRACEDSNGETA